MPKFSDEQKAELTKRVLRQAYGNKHEWYHLFGILFAQEVFSNAREIGISWDDFPFDTIEIAKRLDEMKRQMREQRSSND